ncbi:hypothetical protein ANCDUO_23122 [Ancylostoma duodenale]|uniref:Uncharacterized protein n=1 Tax=Ancylostoma duodenale TaxID=51022 RepID=A0A0C2CAH0_9BILA|nr:hypothetical protein ANCDUO_23122 [Ancylostoma duodenale]
MGDEENSAKFARVVRDCAKTSTEAVENVEKFLAALKNTGKDLEILERIRPIEQKMKSQIDRLTQGVHNGELKAPPRARPDQMERSATNYRSPAALLQFYVEREPRSSCSVGPERREREREKRGIAFDDDSESEEDEVGEEEEEKKAKKYVPPKMMAVRYEEEENEKETKAVERAKRRALQSSLVQELRQQYSDAPEEFREKSRRKYEADKERERFEEDHFVRLRMSKAEKKRERLQNRDNAIDDLFNFGNYMMRDESGEALSNSKKRKASRTGGPRGKKSRFDRKKSQKLKAKSKHKAIKRRQ